MNMARNPEPPVRHNTDSGDQTAKEKQSRGRQILYNFSSCRMPWLWAITTFCFCFLSSWYVHVVLISLNPPPAHLSLSPGRTVLAVNVVAHVVAFMVWNQVETALETLRWALAGRHYGSGKEGISLTCFLALSRATTTLGVAMLMLVPAPLKLSSHHTWCAKRLLFMGLSFILGIILTSNVAYKNIYSTSDEGQVNVLAGLAPVSLELDISPLLGFIIPVSVINPYYITFSYSLLTDNRFSVAIPPTTCSGVNCSSIFLPGGAAIVQDLDNPGSFLFSGHAWDDTTAILVHDAPGYQVEFAPAPQGWSFNKSVDCTAYGQTSNDGLYFCLSTIGPRIIAGWSVCPTHIYIKSACFNDTSWTDQLEQTTTMTLSKRYATVAYSGTNFTILSVESISPPNETIVAADQYRQAVSKVLSPVSHSVNASSPGWSVAATTYTIQYTLGWGLRLYQDQYPGNQAPPLEALYNFLAIPVQFATTAVYFAEGIDKLPTDLRTKATITRIKYRAIAEPWVLKVYFWIAVFLSFWALGCLFFACSFYGRSLDLTEYPELDLITKYKAAKYGRDGREAVKGEQRLGHLELKKSTPGLSQIWSSIKHFSWQTSLEGWRVRIGRYHSLDKSKQKAAEVIISDDSWDGNRVDHTRQDHSDRSYSEKEDLEQIRMDTKPVLERRGTSDEIEAIGS